MHVCLFVRCAEINGEKEGKNAIGEVHGASRRGETLNCLLLVYRPTCLPIAFYGESLRQIYTCRPKLAAIGGLLFDFTAL